MINGPHAWVYLLTLPVKCELENTVVRLFTEVRKRLVVPRGMPNPSKLTEKYLHCGSDFLKTTNKERLLVEKFMNLITQELDILLRRRVNDVNELLGTIADLFISPHVGKDAGTDGED